MYKQVIDVLNQGIVILDAQYIVREWNSWMEINSGLSRDELIGKSLFNHYPELSTPSFTRSCKSVLRFGNYVYYSQKLHRYLFPFKLNGVYSQHFEFMQQSCSMTPIRDEQGQPVNIVISVQNVTESVYLEQNLKMMTRQDSLTGIYNRRFLDNRLEEEFKRFRRSGRRFSLLMIDIDNFKSVNDSYGHQFGDQVLKAIARCCTSAVRGSDIVARFGGEEFSIALMDSSAEGALSFAERLRATVEACSVSTEKGESVRVTVSIGVDEVSESCASWQDIVGNADIALYTSKRSGKNCVTLYTPSVGTKPDKRRSGDK